MLEDLAKHQYICSENDVGTGWGHKRIAESAKRDGEDYITKKKKSEIKKRCFKIQLITDIDNSTSSIL